MLYYFKKGKNTSETERKRFGKYMEKVLGLIKFVRSGL